MPFRSVPYPHLSQHPPLSFSRSDTRGLHHACEPMSEILNGCADIPSQEREERERRCGEREIRLEDTGNVALNIVWSRYCLSLFLSFSLIDFIVLSFSLRFSCPFYLIMVVVICPRIHASSFSVRDGEFEKCSALVCFGTGRVASVIWGVKLPSISANVCFSSTTGSDIWTCSFLFHC